MENVNIKIGNGFISEPNTTPRTLNFTQAIPNENTHLVSFGSIRSFFFHLRIIKKYGFHVYADPLPPPQQEWRSRDVVGEEG